MKSSVTKPAAAVEQCQVKSRKETYSIVSWSSIDTSSYILCIITLFLIDIISIAFTVNLLGQYILTEPCLAVHLKCCVVHAW